MATPKNRVRIAAAAALGLAALASPLLGSTGDAGVSATGDCLAWFGSKGDGVCMGYSNGTPTYIGTPNFGIWGPGYGNGLGITSGPLMPGTTISQGISP